MTTRANAKQSSTPAPAWWAPLLMQIARWDAAWFDEHPDATERRRPAVPGEWWPARSDGLTTIVTTTPSGELVRRVIEAAGQRHDRR